MHNIVSEVTKTSYLYRLSGSMRIQVMPMESGLYLSAPMDAPGGVLHYYALNIKDALLTTILY